MTYNVNINTYLNILSLVSMGVVAFYVVRSKVKDENVKDLRERVAILEKEREEAREQHVQNQKAIANLEGQLQTYKEIPLKSIASSLEALPKIVESNDKILKAIEKQSDVARAEAHDGGLLVQTKKGV